MRRKLRRLSPWIVLVLVSLSLPLVRWASYRLTDQAVLTFKGHNQVVWSVAFSPDGKRLASASGYPYANPGEVKVWDASTGGLLLTLRGHSNIVWSVAFSPDGQRLASGSEDKTVKLWDVSTGRQVLVLPHTSRVQSVAFRPGGKQFASRSEGKVQVWDVTSGDEGHTLDVGALGVNREQSSFYGAGRSLAFSPDGKRLATGAGDNVTVWDAETGKLLLTLKGHRCDVNSVTFSPDSTWLASASGCLPEPGEVRVWDVATGKELLTLEEHILAVSSVAWSPNGQWLASGSRATRVGVFFLFSTPELKVWNALTGREILTLKGHTDYIQSVAFSQDGERLATGSSDKTVKIWKMTD
jgi:WD40 repeat protein